MPNKVCIDTNILKYSLYDGNGAVAEYLKLKKLSLRYLKECENAGDTVILSALSMAEMSFHRSTVDIEETIKESFLVQPFNTRCACEYDKIVSILRNKKQQNLDYNQLSRLRNDLMILATALATKADVLVTHDAEFRSYAVEFIDTKDVTDISYQEELILTEN